MGSDIGRSTCKSTLQVPRGPHPGLQRRGARCTPGARAVGRRSPTLRAPTGSRPPQHILWPSLLNQWLTLTKNGVRRSSHSNRAHHSTFPSFPGGLGSCGPPEGTVVMRVGSYEMGGWGRKRVFRGPHHGQGVWDAWVGRGAKEASASAFRRRQFCTRQGTPHAGRRVCK